MNEDPRAEGGQVESQAQEVLLAALERRGSLDEIELEELCAMHPALAPELRRMHAGCLELAAVLEGLRPPEAERAGEHSSASTWGGAGHESSAANELVRRLAHRRTACARYRVVSERGRGSMGAVYEVWDDDLRRPLAMKVSLEQTTPGSSEAMSPQSARRLGRFLDEAQIMGQLEHPGVVPVHELGVDSAGRVYFTMTLVQGEDLRRVLARMRAGEPEWTRTRLLGVLLSVCETLAHAHERGVIHRDLKPANVMVGRFGQVYVMDWGLAGVLDRAGNRPQEGREPPGSPLSTVRKQEASESPASPLVTREGDVIGTPTYMAPEQARAELSAIDQRADVYAVGAMLYELLAGRAPYAQDARQRSSARRVLEALRAGPPAPLHELCDDLPPELEAICERAMARAPKDRYPSTLDLARDLRAFLEGRAVAAYRTGALVELQKWVRRNRGIAAALAALLLVALGALGLVAALESSRKRGLSRAFGELALERDAKQRLGDMMAAQVLVRDTPRHTPDAEGVARMQRWIERARELLDRRRLYTAIEPRSGDPLSDEEIEELDHNLDRIAELAPAVEQRYADVRLLAQRSLVDHAEEWERAIEEIAASPVYGGLRIQPQLGLVPLRKDPDSGLWEFWQIVSGERPLPNPTSGRWQLEEGSGIVLVLLPPGEATLGSPWNEPGRSSNEGRRTLSFGAFFLSKYETTQAQWMRCWSEAPNPSNYPYGTERYKVQISALHPVESIDWNLATAFAERLGLRLPTEEEWEYACRAGSDAAFHFGPAPESLQDAENLGDSSLMRDVAGEETESILRPAPWDDGHPITSPVGSFVANAFGLYDVHGNVAEWTSSAYRGDPNQPHEWTGARVARGGSHMHGPAFARSAMRQAPPPTHVSQTIGVRLARSIQ